MTGNIRGWNLGLASLSGIHAEEMKSVLDGSKLRLLDTAESDQRDGIKVVMEAQNIHSPRQWELLCDLKREEFNKGMTAFYF